MINVCRALLILDGMENTVSATVIRHLGVTVVPSAFTIILQRVVVVRRSI